MLNANVTLLIQFITNRQLLIDHQLTKIIIHFSFFCTFVNTHWNMVVETQKMQLRKKIDQKLIQFTH